MLLAACLGALTSDPTLASSDAARAMAERALADTAGWVSVWVDLDLPELATIPRDRRAERDALRSQILAQQDAVMARLRDLGAIEQARVQQVRNTLAVRLPGAQLDTARYIPGVRAVRLVRHVERGPLGQGK